MHVRCGLVHRTSSKSSIHALVRSQRGHFCLASTAYRGGRFLWRLLRGIATCATTGHRTSPAGLVVGAMSVAALSGWFAFVAGNFYGIVRGGWSEATAGHDRDVSQHLDGPKT